MKMTANLNYPLLNKERIVKLELAGGALLDVGIYPLNFAYMHFGDHVKEIHSAAQMTSAGVDGENGILLLYEDGRMAVLKFRDSW